MDVVTVGLSCVEGEPIPGSGCRCTHTCTCTLHLSTGPTVNTPSLTHSGFKPPPSDSNETNTLHRPHPTWQFDGVVARSNTEVCVHCSTSSTVSQRHAATRIKLNKTTSCRHYESHYIPLRAACRAYRKNYKIAVGYLKPS